MAHSVFPGDRPAVDNTHTYAFIDVDYLRRRFEEQMNEFYGAVPVIDFGAVQTLLGAGRTYYYDAINYSRGANETEAAAAARIEAREVEQRDINSLPCAHVRNGFVRRGRKGNGQKGVDVQLAVDALEHAAHGNMKVAYLLAGDLDFEPLLRSLERLGVRTKVFYVGGTASLDLLDAADERQQITLVDFYAFASRVTRFDKDGYGPLVIEMGRGMQEEGYRLACNGTWQGRAAVLFWLRTHWYTYNALTDTQRDYRAHIWISGFGFKQQAFRVHYPDIDKLLTGFTQTFGPIEWRVPRIPFADTRFAPDGWSPDLAAAAPTNLAAAARVAVTSSSGSRPKDKRATRRRRKPTAKRAKS